MAGFEYRFAKRITFRNKRSISRLVVSLAIISVMLGVAVMEISISIVNGFEREIQNKIIGFGSHVQIGNLLQDLESTLSPIEKDNEFVPQIQKLEHVKSVRPYISKPAMIKSDATQEGIVLKGVEHNYNWDFYQNAMKEGTLPDYSGDKESKEILISLKLSELLDVHLGDNCFVYFFEDNVKVRKLKIAGIYETGMEEFDLMQVMCDMRLLQQVMGWDNSEVMGFEVQLDELKYADQFVEKCNDILPYEYDANSIRDIYPELFEWVSLQHQNVWFILLLMVMIAVINMVSVILILILERTRTIGLLKAIGLSNFRSMKIFIYNAFFLILTGVACGNLLGLGLIFSQDKWGWLKVDQESYFVNVVPVDWVWDSFILTNLGVLGICTLFMFIPAMMVLSISPAKAVRFE